MVLNTNTHIQTVNTRFVLDPSYYHKNTINPSYYHKHTMRHIQTELQTQRKVLNRHTHRRTNTAQGINQTYTDV